MLLKLNCSHSGLAMNSKIAVLALGWSRDHRTIEAALKRSVHCSDTSAVLGGCQSPNPETLHIIVSPMTTGKKQNTSTEKLLHNVGQELPFTHKYIYCYSKP